MARDAADPLSASGRIAMRLWGERTGGHSSFDGCGPLSGQSGHEAASNAVLVARRRFGPRGVRLDPGPSDHIAKSFQPRLARQFWIQNHRLLNRTGTSHICCPIEFATSTVHPEPRALDFHETSLAMSRAMRNASRVAERSVENLQPRVSSMACVPLAYLKKKVWPGRVTSAVVVRLRHSFICFG